MAAKVKTGVVMLNMGGPARLQDVRPFLTRLFSDGEIIDLGRWQSRLGPWIANRRAPKIEEQYDRIGGGSPIGSWTALQGRAMAKRLDVLSPGTAPHKAYTAFRYADPSTQDALQEMHDDGVERAIAFSQYPAFSCTTTGSSLNHLWRELDRLGLREQFAWSVIDRWATHPGYVSSVAECIESALGSVDEPDRTILLFSSHSLPLKVIARGDPYAQEMAAAVQMVVEGLDRKQIRPAHIHGWQSKVGLLPWIGPNTGSVLEGLGRTGHRSVVVVPIGFTSDHVETLFELDVEYAELAEKAGITNFVRAPSLNGRPLFLDALADIVADHIASGRAVASDQYKLNCYGCTNPDCRTVTNPVKPFTNLRTRTSSGVRCTSPSASL